MLQAIKHYFRSSRIIRGLNLQTRTVILLAFLWAVTGVATAVPEIQGDFGVPAYLLALSITCTILTVLGSSRRRSALGLDRIENVIELIQTKEGEPIHLAEIARIMYVAGVMDAQEGKTARTPTDDATALLIKKIRHPDGSMPNGMGESS